MGLYERDFGFGLEFSKAKLKVVGALVLLGILLIALIFVFSSFFQPKAIAATLKDNPLHLKEKRFTELTVIVTNTTQETAKNVILKAEAEDSQALIIGTSSSDSEKIELIESGLNRKLSFLVWPRENIKEGNYRINISTTINGKKFTDSVVLQVFQD